MSMLSLKSSVITGGIFTQVNNFNVQSRSSQKAWDRLQSAVAPGAFHNAAKRFDPPRCHPNTRIGVMNELRNLTLRRGAAGTFRILWLSGGAGAGKSAIAQSFCEECFPKKLLLASFFFSRSDSSRNNSKSFVATLVYQIYQGVPARNQSLILAVIENDPLVFERSIDAQFTALVMDPLRDLVEGGHFFDNAPSIIVVDGLDECSTSAAQISILNALQNIYKLPQCPFVFVVASRPEHDIQMFFRSFASSLGNSLRQITLDDSYRPHADVELFLREKIQEVCVTNPYKDSIPQGWPSREAIKTLVWKSSGHFIYSSVVIKYIASSRHYPPDRLEVVLGLRPPRRGHPLAELDTLYSHIFSSVEDINLVLQILRIVLLFADGTSDLYMKDVEQLCNLDQGECLNVLSDLQSLVQISPPQQPIRLLHKSLSDYLRDPSRSHGYYIDLTPKMVIPILTHCLRIVSDATLENDCRWTDFILGHRSLLISNIQMCHDSLMSFSVNTCQKTIQNGAFGRSYNVLEFSFHMLNALWTLEGTEYEYIYYHHLHQLAELARCSSYDPWRKEHQKWLLPMLMIPVLSGKSEVHVPPEVFDFLRPLSSYSRLTHIAPSVYALMWLENLSCATAHRCINYLMHDRYSTSAVFALECLYLILPRAKLFPELNEACHVLRRLLDYSSTGRSLAYDFMGRRYAQRHYTVVDMTKEIEQKACQVMQKYMEHYAKQKISDANNRSPMMSNRKSAA